MNGDGWPSASWPNSTEQIATAQAARDAIRHGLRCPHEDITRCPNFNAGITARLAGQPLARSHQQLHGQRQPPES